MVSVVVAVDPSAQIIANNQSLLKRFQKKDESVRVARLYKRVVLGVCSIPTSLPPLAVVVRQDDLILCLCLADAASPTL